MGLKTLLFSCLVSANLLPIAVQKMNFIKQNTVPSKVISGNYGVDHANQTFQLFFPSKLTPEPVPVYLFMLGGGWSQTFPNTTVSEYAQQFLDLGIAFCNVQYGYTTQANQAGIFPNPEIDAQKAIAYFRSNSDKYNLNPSAIVGGGRSAGAHNMLWATLSSDLIINGVSSRPNALCVQQVAFAWLPSMLQNINSPSVTHFDGVSKKMSTVATTIQLAASPVTWIQQNHLGSDIPISIVGGNMEVTKPTTTPYQANMVEWNHDIWCSFVLKQELDTRGGPQHKRFSEFYWQGHPTTYDTIGVGKLQATFIANLFKK